jgi:D-3-phosphoglycerate dehydrogenase / 2-oxoglutarate reductase
MKVLMTEPLQPSGQAVFNDHADVEVVTPEALSEEALIEAVREVQGIAVRSAKLTPNVLAAATELRAVSRHGVGYDNIHVPTLTSRSIPLLLAIHANAVSVAEHTMYFLLSLAKRGRIYDSAARDSDFALRNSPVAIDIADKTLTIVGFGRIGTRLARRALAFDMVVNVCDPYVADSRISEAGCIPVDDFRSVLSDTDFLTVHCPLNDETRHIVGPAELAGMGKGSFVINCARGGIVDEVALTDALDSGAIAGAGIDVYEQEPPPADHPFLANQRIFLSPHSAGVSVEAARRMSFETADNLIAALENRYNPDALANPEIVA